MSNLKLWVISKAWYDDDGVGFSRLMEHFPHVIGATTPYDTVTGIMRPVGRHPDTGDPLWVTGYDRYAQEVTTPGIMSAGALLTPDRDTIPAVTVTGCTAYDFDVAQAVHAHAQHLVLALEPVDSEEDPPISGWGKDDPFTSSLWTQIRNGLVALGMDADTIDDWRTANPDATRREFYGALSRFITRQEK